ncbi:hypothetical protein PXD56_16240 [Maribacter sp. SA7]|uniref:hypothetical protein n=1 Tax=Maribacter zhoushanensis TaxID=3030012 RepID=UPI0023ED8E02|nr:hypothetical protein [Maribacter zhoushanensis]MDF4204527.1 hypothetical protein [Maribacter zhoushanensis]
MIFRFNIFLLSVFILTTSFSLDDSKSAEAYKYSIERFPTMTESLRDGEQFTIQISSIGCYHGERQTITVHNNAGVLSARLNEKRKILSLSDINEFIDFEIQLRELKFGGCTTVDTYVLSNTYDSYKVSDSTCSWSGYKKLIALFTK